MKKGFPPTGGTPAPPTGGTEEIIANVIDLDLVVLESVEATSRFSVHSVNEIYEVKLNGRQHIGILDEEASSWASSRTLKGAKTYQWSAESGIEFLLIQLFAKS